MSTSAPEIQLISVDLRSRCGVCGDALTGDLLFTCYHCGVAQHHDCHAFVHGCGTYGCAGNGAFLSPPPLRQEPGTVTLLPGRRFSPPPPARRLFARPAPPVEDEGPRWQLPRRRSPVHVEIDSGCGFSGTSASWLESCGALAYLLFELILNLAVFLV